MLEAFVSGFWQVLAWPAFGYMLMGISIGFFVGLLPGIGGLATLALIMPFSYTIKTPIEAFSLLLGMLAVTSTTGDLTSILFGIPGEGTAAAATLALRTRIPVEREVQLACTHAMLMCLDREHRVAYILGEIFEMHGETYYRRLEREVLPAAKEYGIGVLPYHPLENGLLTGKYSGTEDGGATHLVVVPPSDTQPSVAIEVFEPCYACVDASLSAVDYAAVAVTGGYEIELSWPWASTLGTFSPGDRVALNLVVGAQDDPGAGLQLEGLLANNPVDGETPCGGATHPGCDDRTWCYSALE